MRRLLITRGAQGAGKTTTVSALGLADHVLSADGVRGLLAGPELTPTGGVTRTQEHEARVWRLTLQLLEERMARGELIVIDATHRRARDLKPYRELAHRHRYRLLCLDFSDVPLEVCLARNAARRELEVVPEEVVRRFWEDCRQGEVPEDVPVVRVGADGVRDPAALAAFLDEPVRDVSRFEAVLHVGDLQGCAAPLLDAGGLLEGGLRPDTLHVFVGDLCDRGPENARVLRWMAEVVHRDDVVLVWGNHEDHLHRWSRGLAPVSREFERHTLPELEAAGLTPELADHVVRHAVDLLRYTWRGHRVLVTHAGLPRVPERPVWISSRQLARGAGGYHDPVDERFDALAAPGWVQVHGHRNLPGLPVRASPRSFNLEGEVEFGGHLRAVRLDADGWTPITVRNRVFRTLGERLALGTQRHRHLLPPWCAPGMPAHPDADLAWLDALRAHPLVRERPSTTLPHVVALHFTRDAFFDAAWDELNVTARGLFVDRETGRVVARSYDKFFNVGERPETQPAALAGSLVFPVTLWVKENGYLGIVGYDARTDALVFASKSSLESDHAAWLRERLDERLGPSGLDRLRQLLRDTHAGLVFEVIEPERDPHIIPYPAPRLVLLDVVHRAATFQRAPYEQLAAWGERLGLPVKERALTLRSWPELARFLEVSAAPDWTWRGQPIEGFVIEDAAGFQTKVKLTWYARWKRLRGLKDRVLTVRGTDRPLRRDLSDPTVAAFHAWCLEQPDALLRQDIGRVRAAFLGDAGAPPPLPAVRRTVDPSSRARAPRSRRPDTLPPGHGLALLVSTVRQTAVPPPAGWTAAEGMGRALDGLARHVAGGGAIKAASADALVARALGDPEALAALRAHPLAPTVLAAASRGEARAALAGRLGLDDGGA